MSQLEYKQKINNKNNSNEYRHIAYLNLILLDFDIKLINLKAIEFTNILQPFIK